MTQKPAVLLIGDHTSSARVLQGTAHSAGCEVLHAPTLDAALTSLGTGRIGMVFLDASLDVPAYFTFLKSQRLNVPTVCVGPSQPAQNAAKAIRLGAIEYLSTPPEPSAVQSLVSKLAASVSPTAGSSSQGPVAGDAKTLQLMEMVKKFAASQATVLLRGESGTGKEVFSQLIHQNSPRKDKPFISINCAAIPENLLESELFGHEKGAFSGALTQKLGKFQLADKGTLLLDEISEMDATLQAKLLRAIQERVVDPIGATKPVPVDIRLIATTNRDLEKEVAAGRFREDLYFRLNVVMLEIPALRERKGDILPLARFFAHKYGEQNGLADVEISPEAAGVLERCYWKGNVRELENTLHRAVLLMGPDAVMTPEHIVISPMSLAMGETGGASPDAPAVVQNNQSAAAFAARHAAGAYGAAAGGFESGTGVSRAAAPLPASSMADGTPLVGRTMQDVEKELILETLNYCKGNRIHAADILGISIRVLREKLQAYEDGAL